ncbi:hypothetical protein EMIHUDRAFT_365614 [Emiliania huxleyi CCMP1516]|uniref:sphingolipid C(9)-methyltransferase n=2 Tax=Emiliania huxleyi TaxID=2903 RepID=A0A0D3K2F7_EMIH1|nr:hypothetical protein EMIHUDRAFT_365614 [Emiliania huxleyi CCMP1516]EOD29942.1 hypothetical protein EMIHUDRAFT_365614 [Emiliania huxleyi CCMP1516]|eukprot:XP_005782371.1 hypothetical protein EMIHUDRAFT_365614 [Emiliania huxleyi CCMP1516]
MVLEKIYVGVTMANKWTDPTSLLIIGLAGGVPALLIAEVAIALKVGLVYTAVLPGLIWLWYQFHLRTPPADTEAFLTFKDASLRRSWAKNKIPMHILVEAFLDDKVAFKKDVFKTLDEHREDFIDWRPTWNLALFLIRQALPSTSSSFKSIAATKKEIADHYDMGNDFFGAFMGPLMIYTSAIYHGLHQTLEQAQTNKLDTICEKLHLKPGQRMLDIGCGWGTLARHAASRFKARSIGVTLSKEGAAWCREQNAKEGLSQEQCDILMCDYREIPRSDGAFDAISAVEMAEHVGLANFTQPFLSSIFKMLKDDGLFFMQVAGLRKGSNWQDVQWGLFMSKYIFPGADASTPLYWYTQQLEKAGFEVHSVENIGRHYSHTLKAWYDNFQKNKSKPEIQQYPARLHRLWDIFLAWSVVAAGQGSATCYQIVSHKNLYSFPRDNFCSDQIARPTGPRA